VVVVVKEIEWLFLNGTFLFVGIVLLIAVVAVWLLAKKIVWHACYSKSIFAAGLIYVVAYYSTYEGSGYNQAGWKEYLGVALFFLCFLAFLGYFFRFLRISAVLSFWVILLLSLGTPFVYKEFSASGKLGYYISRMNIKNRISRVEKGVVGADLHNFRQEDGPKFLRKWDSRLRKKALISEGGLRRTRALFGIIREWGDQIYETAGKRVTQSDDSRES
jgi:hypothetical protein